MNEVVITGQFILIAILSVLYHLRRENDSERLRCEQLEWGRQWQNGWNAAYQHMSSQRQREHELALAKIRQKSVGFAETPENP